MEVQFFLAFLYSISSHFERGVYFTSSPLKWNTINPHLRAANEDSGDENQSEQQKLTRSSNSKAHTPTAVNGMSVSWAKENSPEE